VRSGPPPRGVLRALGPAGGLLGMVWIGRTAIPPARLSMPESSIGHGTSGSYECLPPSKHQIRANQLDGLRCGSMLREPGGIKEGVVHVWTLRGRELARLTPDRLDCDGDGVVFRSTFPMGQMPKDPTGKWACETFTTNGQLVGLKRFEVLTKDGKSLEDAGPGSGSGSAVGSGSAGSATR